MPLQSTGTEHRCKTILTIDAKKTHAGRDNTVRSWTAPAVRPGAQSRLTICCQQPEAVAETWVAASKAVTSAVTMALKLLQFFMSEDTNRSAETEVDTPRTHRDRCSILQCMMSPRSPGQVLQAGRQAVDVNLQ